MAKTDLDMQSKLYIINDNHKNKLYGQLFYVEESLLHNCPLIILSHGYNCSYLQCIDTITALCNEGFAVFGFDFVGGSVNSKSGGDTKNMSVLTEMENLNTVVNYIMTAELPLYINKDKIILLGESQGGVVSALTAAKRDDIHFLVLYYPAFCLLDDGKKRYNYDLSNIPEEPELMDMTIGRRYYSDIWDMDLCKEAALYTGNVLILHGTDDSLVPYEYSVNMSAIYKNAMLAPIKGAGHGFEGNDVKHAANIVKDYYLAHQ